MNRKIAPYDRGLYKRAGKWHINVDRFTDYLISTLHLVYEDDAFRCFGNSTRRYKGNVEWIRVILETNIRNFQGLYTKDLENECFDLITEKLNQGSI